MRRGAAFWLLPAADEALWIRPAGAPADLAVLRWAGTPAQELLLPEDPARAAEALAALAVLCAAGTGGLRPEVWTAAEPPAGAPGFACAGAEAWGVYLPGPRQRLAARTAGAPAAACRRIVPAGADPAARPHPGFPPPLAGRRYRVAARRP